MTTSTSHWTYYLHQYWFDLQDPRSAHIPLTNVPPYQFVSVILFFILFVTKIGPALMNNREPFRLRRPIICYNIFMVAVNAYYFVQALKRSGYGAKLANFDYGDRSEVNEQMLDDLHIGFFYFLSKFVDWLDTLFFVLRKKYAHISFLHVYHHSMVPLLGYLCLKINPFLPGVYLFVICNSFVHTVMYSYYALSAFGPRIQKYLWWKKYITQLQLGQFGIYCIYTFILFRYQTRYPTVWLYFALSQPPFFFWMFYDFYRRSYTKVPQASPHLQQDKAAASNGPSKNGFPNGSTNKINHNNNHLNGVAAVGNEAKKSK